MMSDCLDEDKLNYEYGKKDPDIDKTDKFSHSKWVAWEDMVYTYFTATKNIPELTITYVICNTPAP